MLPLTVSHHQHHLQAAYTFKGVTGEKESTLRGQLCGLAKYGLHQSIIFEGLVQSGFCDMGLGCLLCVTSLIQFFLCPYKMLPHAQSSE